MCLYVSELKRIQQTDLENLEKTLKETETSLSVRDVHVITLCPHETTELTPSLKLTV